MKDYKVGQVLYVISDKTTKIIPVQVVEEVTRKNMKGSQITYTVLLPDKDMSQIDINEIKGEIFNSISTLREKMLSNAVSAIDKMIERTNKVVDSAFEVKSENFITTTLSEESQFIPDIPKLDNVQNNFNDDIIKVDLGGGTIAKMKAKDLNLNTGDE